MEAQMELGIRHVLCKNFREGRNLHWIMCSNYDLWSMGLDGNGQHIASASSTNYLGIFLAIKMVAPLENGRNAILVLNRKRQFSLFNYGQYNCQSLD